MTIKYAESVTFLFSRSSASYAIETSVNITGISMSGPITVETATIGIEANAVNSMSMASLKLLPVQ